MQAPPRPGGQGLAPDSILEVSPVCEEISPVCEVDLRWLDGARLVLRVTGTLDAVSVPTLSAQFDQVQCTPCPEILLDLSEIAVLDSVGCNAIAGLCHYISARGDRITIRCRSAAIRGLLGSIGLRRHLEAVASDPDGTAACMTG